MKEFKDYQIEAIDTMFEAECMINAYKMGLGKTIIALGVIDKIKEYHWKPTVTIVCPSYMIGSWEDEIREWLPDYTVDSKKKFKQQADIRIISYGSVAKNPSLFSRDIVVADECQYLKNLEAQRTIAFHKALNKYKPHHVYLLSGTPISNSVGDFYSLLRIVTYRKDPMNFKLKYPSITKFKDTFSNKSMKSVPVKRWRHGKKVTEWTKVPEWTGLKNREMLKKLIAPVYIRKVTEEVIDLPDLTVQHINLRTLKGTKDLIESYDPEGHAASRLRQHALSKVKATANFIDGIVEGGEKVVVFSFYPEVIHQIKKHLKSSCEVIADLPEKERYPVAKSFQSQGFNVFGATFGTGSTGLTLTVANVMVINDLSWKPDDNEQAIYRIKRVGQTKKCRCYIMASGEYDKERNNRIAEKTEVLNSAM